MVSPSHTRSAWHPLDTWLLRRADFVIAAGAGEAQFYRRQGIAETRILEVPPGVASPAQAEAREALCRRLGIEASSRLIVCAGPLVAEKGFHDAIWTFAILRLLFEDLHLVF